MSNRRTFAWTLSLVMIAAMSEPALSQEASSHSHQSISISEKDGVQRWRTTTALTDFNIELRGKIELTDDDKDIKSISDDGYLEIEKTVFGSKRTIVIESMGGGTVKKEYYEGRTKMDWDKYGKEWLAEVLPELVRSSTIGSESRVNRFFKKGGVPAVLQEIDAIESDYIKSHYANLLMKQPVQAKEYATIINKLAQEIDSDHYITEFLKKNIDKFMQNKEATAAVFAATHRMDSDHYKTVIIKEALKGQIASLDNVKIILQAASKMESDHYITEVLTSLLKQENLSDALIAEMIATTNSIESDHYKTVILTKSLDKDGLSNASFAKVVDAVKDIESDHYITEVIKHLLDNKLTDDLLTLLTDVLGSIESDHYRTEVLKKLLTRQDLTETQFTKVIKVAGDMGSDHYKMTILRQVVMAPNASDSKILAVLNETGSVDSDHYLTEILTAAAPKVKTGSANLRDAYRAAAKRISSETYYGRALRAIE
jgi:hypothetical protein